MRSSLSPARKISLATACALAFAAGVLSVQTAQATPFAPTHVGLVQVGSDVVATSIDAASGRHERLVNVGAVGQQPRIAKVGDSWYVTTGAGASPRVVRRLQVGSRTLSPVVTLAAPRAVVDGAGSTPFSVALEDPGVDVERAEAHVLRPGTLARYADTPINTLATRAAATPTTLCVLSHEGRTRVQTYTLGQPREKTYPIPVGTTADAIACTAAGPIVAGGNGRTDTHSAGASTIPTINVTTVGALRSVQTYGRAQQVAAHGKNILVASGYDSYVLIANVDDSGAVRWSQIIRGVERVTALRSTGDGALVAAGQRLYRLLDHDKKVEIEELGGNILGLA